MKILILLLISFLQLENVQAELALIYKGPGSCKDLCSEAAAQIARNLGLSVKFLGPADLKAGAKEFQDAAVWIQPGGNAIDAAEALGEKGLKWIRQFVKNGGGYVGFCAGAFLADSTVDNPETIKGLGIIPVETVDYPVDSKKGNGIILSTFWFGKRRELFFNGGGTFYMDGKHPVNVLATYGLEGLPATIENQYGYGRVVVTGAHPEALDDWKKYTGMDDKDGPDYDLAEMMVRRAIRRN